MNGITIPTIASLYDKPYSLVNDPSTFNFVGFGLFPSRIPSGEDACAIYDWNTSSPFNISIYNYIIIQGSDWSFGSLSWCPNGLSGWGDYNYDGYSWNMHNYSGQGSSLKVWIKEY